MRYSNFAQVQNTTANPSIQNFEEACAHPPSPTINASAVDTPALKVQSIISQNTHLKFTPVADIEL